LLTRGARVIRLAIDTYGAFFFFQAEDGIRDSSVTGVQTCALPIFVRSLTPRDGVLLHDEVDGGARRARDRRHDRRRGVPRKGRQIGRASCRERGEMWGGGGALKKRMNSTAR